MKMTEMKMTAKKSLHLKHIPWGADLSYIPFSQASPVKREPVALSVQRHAGNTYVLPEQKPFPPTLLRESITLTPLGCTSNWDSAVLVNH